MTSPHDASASPSRRHVDRAKRPKTLLASNRKARHDYSILETKAEYMAYSPEKLSMERVEDPAFTPADRIGALEMQNLSITDNRAFLVHHLESVARLGQGQGGNPLPELLGKPEK